MLRKYHKIVILVTQKMASRNNKKVIILMPDPVEWIFMSYVTDRGRIVTEDWDTHQSFEAETALDTFIESNRKTKDYMQWPEWKHKMHGSPGKEGVVEFGFKATGKQYRVLCIFKGKMCVVILCMAFHKQNVWDPPGTEKTVTDRAKEVKNSTAKLKLIEKEKDEESKDQK
jgi:hypothetical protein